MNTAKQRIFAALENGVPDRVPIYEHWINEESIQNLYNLLNKNHSSDKTLSKEASSSEMDYELLDKYSTVVDLLDIDGVGYTFSKKYTDLGKRNKKRFVQDKYGITYKLSEHGEPYVTSGPVSNFEDTKDLNLSSQLEKDDFQRMEYFYNKVKEKKGEDEFVLFTLIDEPFKVSWQLRGGMEESLKDYIANPDLIKKLIEISTDFFLQAVDYAKEIGSEVIVLNGDLADEKNTIISPKHYRNYLKSSHSRIVDYVHDKDLKIIKHSDGNIWPILDDLLECGFDGIHPIQPQCMNIGEVKDHVGNEAALLGNIDCRNLLPFGETQEVREVVKKTIEQAGPDGGYLICSSNSIHPDVKPENYVEMVKAAHQFGPY